jgi:hypothetical protein
LSGQGLTVEIADIAARLYQRVESLPPVRYTYSVLQANREKWRRLDFANLSGLAMMIR